jgi:hypothetical protein
MSVFHYKSWVPPTVDRSHTTLHWLIHKSALCKCRRLSTFHLVFTDERPALFESMSADLSMVNNILCHKYSWQDDYKYKFFSNPQTVAQYVLNIYASYKGVRSTPIKWRDMALDLKWPLTIEDYFNSWALSYDRYHLSPVPTYMQIVITTV